MVHRYSHLGEKFLRITYSALGVKLTGTLQVCYGCARSKEKSCAARKETYTRASHPGEIFFVDTTGPFPDSLIENRYWIGVVGNYSRYSWIFLTETKSQLTKKMGELFKKITSHWNPVEYQHCDNAGEHQPKLHKVCKNV